MKTKLLSTLVAFTLACTLHAADEKHPHDHDHGKIKAGPTGGRLITEVEPHAEFLVNKDSKVEIRFVDDDNKVVPPGEQVVTVTLGERSAPTKLSFSTEGDKLISDKTIPAGNDYPTVVQIRAKEGAKAVNEKFHLNLESCPTCKNKEYACTCAHGAEEEKKGK
ncbi:MAG: hypothetical protein J0L73_25825 [Verrucomicrobia bacterium]|nr:hypothetical protein [Verrucomicrobiota bacterium]